MYFPLIVHEALMIEPTESENRETLDAFIQALKDIDREVTESPELVTQAPHTTPVSRLDEALAARRPTPALDPRGVGAGVVRGRGRKSQPGKAGD